ncbi:hypothetical protein A2U01_0060771 [Trifolium medium]|uniref:Uncharacterized protein n=1 Tax=Trifolium medium TaxID=97028 RepID=A0A392RT52_9FABA|nr:hypothetical protein [Trifolium medium]
MNMRDAQQSEPSCAEILVTGATRHSTRRDAQLAETSQPSSESTGAMRQCSCATRN